MLEIFLVSYLSKKIGEKALERGRKPTGFKAATWIFWFVGEIIGAVLGALILGAGIGLYLFALVGAALGATAVYLFATNCKPGNYFLPQVGMQQAAQMLQAPCIITIVRQDQYPNSPALNIVLNKQLICTIQNGQTINAQTMQWKNEIYVTTADSLSMQPIYFELIPGQAPVIYVSDNRINAAACTGVRLLPSYEAMQVRI